MALLYYYINELALCLVHITHSNKEHVFCHMFPTLLNSVPGVRVYESLAWKSITTYFLEENIYLAHIQYSEGGTIENK